VHVLLASGLPGGSSPCERDAAVFGGDEGLDGLPDPGNRYDAVRESLDWHHARNSVPDFDQAGPGPVARELPEFLLTGELRRVLVGDYAVNDRFGIGP
jgi:hypothetical protein